MNGRLTGAASTWDLGGLARVAEATALDWFAVTDAVSAALVPAHAAWCVLYVRRVVLHALRLGQAEGIDPPGIAEPTEMAALRHYDGRLETILRRFAARLPPLGPSRTGDSLLALDRATLLPVAAPAGDVLGWLWLGPWPPRQRATAVAPDRITDVIGAALTSGWRASTAPRVSAAIGAHRTLRWQPARADRIVPAGRAWARRVLPRLLTAPARPELAVALDQVVGELVRNAVQHGNGLVALELARIANRLRVAAADRDPRAPIVRAHGPGGGAEGRGVPLVNATAAAWGVQRDLRTRGKTVWAELVIR